LKTTQIIEALLFASDAPLSAADLARGEEDLDEAGVVAAIEALRAEYEAEGRAFQVYEIAGGWQLLTRPEYSPHLERFETVPRNTRLSAAALEVLAIIAYRQPIGRLEMEYIRGVGVSGVIRTLQERDLIDVVGRAEGLGRPLLYGTTRHFLEHFGFRSLEDLPRPEELPIVLRERISLGPEDVTGELEAGEEVEDVPAAPGAPAEAGSDGVLDHAPEEAPEGAGDIDDDTLARARAAADHEGDEVFEPDR
jgi:segregation and condensation protein B